MANRTYDQSKAEWLVLLEDGVQSLMKMQARNAEKEN